MINAVSDLASTCNVFNVSKVWPDFSVYNQLFLCIDPPIGGVAVGGAYLPLVSTNHVSHRFRAWLKGTVSQRFELVHELFFKWKHLTRIWQYFIKLDFHFVNVNTVYWLQWQSHNGTSQQQFWISVYWQKYLNPLHGCYAVQKTIKSCETTYERFHGVVSDRTEENIRSLTRYAQRRNQ